MPLEGQGMEGHESLVVLPIIKVIDRCSRCLLNSYYMQGF